MIKDEGASSFRGDGSGKNGQEINDSRNSSINLRVFHKQLTKMLLAKICHNQFLKRSLPKMFFITVYSEESLE